MFARLALQRKGFQVDNSFIANAEGIKSGRLVLFKRLRQGLVKHRLPVALLAQSRKSLNGGQQVIFWSDRIAESHSCASHQCISDHRAAGREEVVFVVKQQETRQRGMT